MSGWCTHAFRSGCQPHLEAGAEVKIRSVGKKQYYWRCSGPIISPTAFSDKLAMVAPSSRGLPDHGSGSPLSACAVRPTDWLLACLLAWRRSSIRSSTSSSPSESSSSFASVQVGWRLVDERASERRGRERKRHCNLRASFIITRSQSSPAILLNLSPSLSL